MPAVTRISVRDLDEVAGVVAQAAAGDGEFPFDLALIERPPGRTAGRAGSAAARVSD